MTTAFILIVDVIIILLLTIFVSSIKKRRRKKISYKKDRKLDRKIFKNEKFIEAQKEYFIREIPHSNDDLFKARKSRIDYFDSYNTGYGIIKGKTGRINDNSKDSLNNHIYEDLATKSATSFEHGGTNLNNNMTNYFNI